MRGTADLLPVDDGSARGAEALMRKQLAGLGVPMPWYDASPTAGHVRARRFWLFVATTDCGPDQLACRKALAARIRPLQRIGFLSMNCLCHQCQIVCSGGLLIVDAAVKRADVSWSYYSSICKLVHVWRDLAKDMYRAWAEMHGDISAERFASRFPPRCIASRWLSLCATEAYLLDRGHLAAAVVERVIRGHTAKDSKDTNIQHHDVNEIAVEDMKAHRQKIGRWRLDVLACISDSRFWLMIEFAHKARGPLDRMHAWLQKVFADASINGYHVRRLVCGKAEALISQIEIELADSDMWWATHIALLPPDDQIWVTHMNASSMLFYASSFHRRVVAMLLAWPYRMFLMRKAPPDDDCPLRRQIADEVLSLRRPGCIADATTIKIPNEYCDVLEIARDDGILHNDLVDLLDNIDAGTTISVQEVEGVNSLIGRQGKACPNQCLDLMSSRICIKKDIGYKELRKNWRVVQPVIESLFSALVDTHARGEAPLALMPAESQCALEDKAMRWQAPQPISYPDLPDPVSSAMVMKEDQAALQRNNATATSAFAAKYCIQWLKGQPKLTLSECIGFATGPSPRVGCTLYTLVDRHYYRGTLVAWKLSENDVIELEMPLRFYALHDVFTDKFPRTAAPVKVHAYDVSFDLGAMTRATIRRGRLALTMNPRKRNTPSARSTGSTANRLPAASVVDNLEHMNDDELEQLPEDVLAGITTAMHGGIGDEPLEAVVVFVLIVVAVLE